MLKIHQISNQLTKVVFSDALKLWVGPSRKLTVEQCAAVTGIGASAIESYRKAQAAPPLENMLKLAAAIDEPIFLNTLLALIGFSGARRETQDAPNPYELNSKAASLVSHLCDALSDGALNHQECAVLLPKAQETLAQLSSFVFNLQERCETNKGRRKPQ